MPAGLVETPIDASSGRVTSYDAKRLRLASDAYQIVVAARPVGTTAAHPRANIENGVKGIRAH